MPATERLLDDRIRDGLRVFTDDAAFSEGLMVAFTDRHGGVSRPPYDSLNLGALVGDSPISLERNRERVAAALGFKADAVARARQVHGIDVARVGKERGSVGDADILVTERRGVVLTISTADCVPVVVANAGMVAIAHAGWRGLVGGAIEKAMVALGGVERAWVGPSIHACCYEVGPEVIDAFEKAGLPVAGADRVDPGRAAISVLRREGVTDVKVTTVCTGCDQRFFSYRRDGVTGRQGAFVSMLEG